jgi:hypothetical protein
LPGTHLHLLYDVEQSVHHANAGLRPEIPHPMRPLVDAGRVVTPYTRVEAMTETARRFFHRFDAEYVGSNFTVRAVLPDVDDTDERPTIVERDGNTVAILSGKIDTAVTAAHQVLALTREAVPA